MDPIVIFAALCITVSVPLLYWTLTSDREARITPEQLLGRSVDLRDVVLSQSPVDRILRPAIAGLASLVRRITPAGRIEKLDKLRAMAALPASITVEKILAAKVVLCAFMFVFSLTNLGGTSSSKSLMLLIGGTAFGFFLPDILVKNKATKRQQVIARELPDTLDQITIAVEAGLGFDAAIDKVARTGDGPMAHELLRTLQHINAGLSRSEALRGLADRNKIQELRQFVSAILQADQYGVPLAQVLRVQSAEARRKRRQAAEEKAMKLPVKILFPLLMCIMPALLIVVVGPAAITIMDTLGNA